MTDPMRMRDQPALTRSSGRIWLVVGGLFALVSLCVLIPMAVVGLPPFPVAAAGAVVVALLYAAMLLARGIARQRRRLLVLAGLLIAMAAVALVAVVVVGFAATL